MKWIEAPSRSPGTSGPGAPAAPRISGDRVESEPIRSIPAYAWAGASAAAVSFRGAFRPPRSSLTLDFLPTLSRI